ncbi:MAG TPA: tetratricopeptide repeat protein, partial [Sphingomicrobium sp.]|nr:tetratricopeptide repeat protein [Sphingomicrobium sp.]
MTAPPDSADHCNRAGLAHVRQGRFDLAADSFRRAVEADRRMGAGHNNLGACLVELGQLDEAVAAFAEAIQIDPDHIEAIHNLGVTLRRLGRHDEAIAELSRAIALKPDYADAHNNLGIAYVEQGRTADAADCYRRALQIDPSNAFAANNLGNALRAEGHYEASLAHYSTALQLNPAYAEAYNNLGLALRDLHRLAEASESFTRAIRLRSRFADAHANLGVTLNDLGRRDEAIASFGHALDIDPELAWARAQRMHLLARNCDWQALEGDLPMVSTLGIEGAAIPPFAMLGFDDHPERHRIRSERFAAERYGHVAQAVLTPPEVRPERLKIGYFSADFSAHAVMYLAARLFELHDRRRFSIHAYSFGPETDDTMRARLLGAFDSFTDVRASSDRAVAEKARDDGIDIGVDLQGYTQRNRVGIFAHRAAPVQIGFLGYPGTSGARFMDYLIADRTVIPDAHRTSYSESLINLPYCYQPNDNSRPIARTEWSRAKANLPQQGFVFCCFNNSYKIGPAEFEIWMDLLERVAGSTLWLMAASDHAKPNLLAAAAKRGVDPDRLVFASHLPLAEHIARLRLADLFLDTFNYNAHTTASDALWAGLPVLTKL